MGYSQMARLQRRRATTIIFIFRYCQAFKIRRHTYFSRLRMARRHDIAAKIARAADILRQY